MAEDSDNQVVKLRGDAKQGLREKLIALWRDARDARNQPLGDRRAQQLVDGLIGNVERRLSNRTAASAPATPAPRMSAKKKIVDLARYRARRKRGSTTARPRQLSRGEEGFLLAVDACLEQQRSVTTSNVRDAS